MPDRFSGTTDDFDPPHESAADRIRRVRLHEIAARLSAVTPWPWMSEPKGKGYCIESKFYEDEDPGICGNHSRDWPLTEGDAEFIENAPEDVQWLLEQLGVVVRNPAYAIAEQEAEAEGREHGCGEDTCVCEVEE